jgi:hypothetical protein
LHPGALQTNGVARITLQKEKIMGERYRAELQERISELGAHNLRVFINADGVHPHYKQHLEETFTEAGVRFVATREEANFLFEGHCEPAYSAGQMVAFFRDERLQFAGAL